MILEARSAEAMQETLDRLRAEVAELRASRERLVVGTDADRRGIERDLHESVQQHLAALAVNLQLAEPLVRSDPAAAEAALEEMRQDVQRALEETAQLAARIYPPLLEAGGFAAALRAAAVGVGVAASVDVAARSTYPPELARTVYLCWLEALEHAGGDRRATLTLLDEEGTLSFEIADLAAGSTAGFERLRDRVEALGGRLTIREDDGRGIHVSGSLPLAR